MNIKYELQTHITVLQQTIANSETLIAEMADRLYESFKRGNKLLICGNGGSAADAQHVAAEFTNRFRVERAALPAIALTTDSSILTSIGNDSSFLDVFSRQVEALGSRGDILVGISTSGRSGNVLKALRVARDRGLVTIGFTGKKGRDSMAPLCDICLVVPSEDTARIQECHEFIWHLVCGAVESQFAQIMQESAGWES